MGCPAGLPTGTGKDSVGPLAYLRPDITQLGWANCPTEVAAVPLGSLVCWFQTSLSSFISSVLRTVHTIQLQGLGQAGRGCRAQLCQGHLAVGDSRTVTTAQDDFLGVSHTLPFTQWNFIGVGTAGASPSPSLGIFQVAWCYLGKGRRSPTT